LAVLVEGCSEQPLAAALSREPLSEPEWVLLAAISWEKVAEEVGNVDASRQ
jgi:hypothetical protein